MKATTASHTVLVQSQTHISLRTSLKSKNHMKERIQLEADARAPRDRVRFQANNPTILEAHTMRTTQNSTEWIVNSTHHESPEARVTSIPACLLLGRGPVELGLANSIILCTWEWTKFNLFSRSRNWTCSSRGSRKLTQSRWGTSRQWLCQSRSNIWRRIATKLFASWPWSTTSLFSSSSLSRNGQLKIWTVRRSSTKMR